jgi:hypothetical protein
MGEDGLKGYYRLTGARFCRRCCRTWNWDSPRISGKPCGRGLCRHRHGTKRSADKPDCTAVGALAGLKPLQLSTRTRHAATRHNLAGSPYCQIDVNGPNRTLAAISNAAAQPVIAAILPERGILLIETSVCGLCCYSVWYARGQILHHYRSHISQS